MLFWIAKFAASSGLCRAASLDKKGLTIVTSSTRTSQTTKRAFNFNAGPGALPLPVLERIREELLDWRGSGMSVMEMSHRSPEFESINADAEQRLPNLLGISHDYPVLFVTPPRTPPLTIPPYHP